MHVILDGRLDIIGANEIDLPFNKTVTASEHPVLIDLQKVSFLGSIGIRMLLGATQALARKGVYCALVRPQPMVRQALELAGLTQTLPLFDDLETATRAATGAPG